MQFAPTQKLEARERNAPHATRVAFEQPAKTLRAFGHEGGGRPFQAKLAVGSPGDAYEQEADRVADAVVANREGGAETRDWDGAHRFGGRLSPEVSRRAPPSYVAVQRMCAGDCGEAPCEECATTLQRSTAPGTVASVFQPRLGNNAMTLPVGSAHEPLESEADAMADRVLTGSAPVTSAHGGLQMKSVDSSGSRTAPPMVGDVVSSGGQPLDSGTLGFMEPRFGHDLSNVRIHTDAGANQAASAVQSLAFTVGNHIVFGRDQYQPHSTDGKRLLAHELTHTLQQQGASAHRVQRQLIHNPLFPCVELSGTVMPGGMDYFGTLVHLAIQQHYVRNIDPLAATEYAIPGSGAMGGTGRADIVSAIGGVYEIKPIQLAADAFLEAVNYLAFAETVCDPHVPWHLGLLYFPPPTPITIGDDEVLSWLEGPGVIAYSRRRRRRQPQTQPVLVPEAVPEPTLRRIREFARRVYEEGLEAEQAAEEFLHQNPGLAAAVAAVGVVALVALIADDATLVGIADDVLVPIVAALEWVALRMLIFA